MIGINEADDCESREAIVTAADGPPLAGCRRTSDALVANHVCPLAPTPLEEWRGRRK